MEARPQKRPWSPALVPQLLVTKRELEALATRQARRVAPLCPRLMEVCLEVLAALRVRSIVAAWMPWWMPLPPRRAAKAQQPCVGAWKDYATAWPHAARVQEAVREHLRQRNETIQALAAVRWLTCLLSVQRGTRVVVMAPWWFPRSCAQLLQEAAR